jgi:hypothetical protein
MLCKHSSLLIWELWAREKVNYICTSICAGDQGTSSLKTVGEHNEPYIYTLDNSKIVCEKSQNVNILNC